MHNLAAFVFHLHFLLGIAVLKKYIDMWQRIKSDLVRVHFLVHLTPAREGFYLLFQFYYAHRTAAGHGLIS